MGLVLSSGLVLWQVGGRLVLRPREVGRGGVQALGGRGGGGLEGGRGYGRGGEGGGEEGGRGRARVVALVSNQALLAVDLEVLPEGGGVGVRLVAPAHVAVVRLVRRVNVHVLLPIARVGEPAITALHFALERFLAYKQKMTIS